MPKYIDADLLRTVVIACSDKQGRFTVDDILMMIDAVKPADVEEVKHGEWIEGGWSLVCSSCGVGKWKGYIPISQEAKKWMPFPDIPMPEVEE